MSSVRNLFLFSLSVVLCAAPAGCSSSSSRADGGVEADGAPSGSEDAGAPASEDSGSTTTTGGGNTGGGNGGCTPGCGGSECGVDGCGSPCGSCPPNDLCLEGHCEPT